MVESLWSERSQEIAARGEARAQMQQHDHAALMYWTRQEYLDTVVPYLAEGLAAGECVVHVHHDEPLEPLLESLAAAGVDVEAALRDGSLQVLAAAAAFAPNGYFDAEASLADVGSMVETARAAGAPRVRMSFDLSFLHADIPGVEDFLELDSRANDEVFATQPFICLCCYNAAAGSEELVETLLTTHPMIYVRGLPLSNPFYRAWEEGPVFAANLRRWKHAYSSAVVE